MTILILKLLQIHVHYISFRAKFTIDDLNLQKLEIRDTTETAEIIKTPKYLLRFDGASKGNPGKSGAGAVLYYGSKEIWHGSKYLGKQTNNYAEYFGMIIGLDSAVKKGIKKLYVEGDSMLIIKQMKGDWKVKNQNLKDLYLIAIKLRKQFEYICFNHIYRDKNKRADELANIGVEQI